MPKTDSSQSTIGFGLTKKTSSSLLKTASEKSDATLRESKSVKKSTTANSKEPVSKQKKVINETIKTKEKAKKDERSKKIETSIKDKPKINLTNKSKSSGTEAKNSFEPYGRNFILNSKGGSKKNKQPKNPVEENSSLLAVDSKGTVQSKSRPKRVNALSAKIDEEENDEAIKSLNDSTNKKTKPNKKRKFDDEAHLNEAEIEASKKRDGEIFGEEVMSDQELLEEEIFDDQIMEEDEDFDEENYDDGKLNSICPLQYQFLLYGIWVLL